MIVRIAGGLLAALLVLLFVSFSLFLSRKGPAIDLTVAAAANLQPAFHEIGAQFENETGLRVVFLFGSSGTLAAQIANGAPVDLYASANQRFVDQLKAQGLVLEDEIFSIGRLALAWSGRPGLEITGLSDLQRPEVKKIAMANPELAPYGAAAKEALVNSGLWESVKDKVVYGENVRQALQFVETGNAEVGFVALSEAAETGTPHMLLDQSLYTPLMQPLAIIKGSRHEESARRFADFVLGPAGRRALEKHGYGVPDR